MIFEVILRARLHFQIFNPAVITAEGPTLQGFRAFLTHDIFLDKTKDFEKYFKKYSRLILKYKKRKALIYDVFLFFFNKINGDVSDSFELSEIKNTDITIVDLHVVAISLKIQKRKNNLDYINMVNAFMEHSNLSEKYITSFKSMPFIKNFF